MAGAVLRAGETFGARDAKPGKSRLPGTALALAGAALLAAALFICENAAGDYPGFKALLPVGAAFLLIAAGPHNPLNRLLLANQACVFLGKISYTLYLWHWPLLSFAYLLLGGPAYEGALALRAALVASSLVLAALTWRLIEVPVRYGNMLGRHKVPALAAAMCLVGAAGLFIWRSEGLVLLSGEHSRAVYSQLKQPAQYEDTVLEKLGLKKDELELTRYTDTGADRTVAIVGDSHAQSAYAGIAKLGKEDGFNTLLLGRFPGRKKTYYDSREHPGRILDILTRRKDIEDVFIIVRGASYTAEAHNPGHRGNDVQRPVSEEEFSAEMADFVRKLAALGKHVIVVEDNPDLDIDVRETLSPVLSRQPVRALHGETRKADVLVRQKTWLGILDQLAELPGVTVLRGTLDAFCPGENCLIFSEDGLPLYFDDDHLSFAGSDKLAREIIAPYFRRHNAQPGAGGAERP